MQYIDARDLAGWMIKALEMGVSGAYNVTGRPTTLGETLNAAMAPGTEVVYRSREQAEALDIDPSRAFAWSVPEAEERIWNVDIERAVATGLHLRPIAETVRDTVAWHRSRQGHKLAAGLSDEEEAKLLG
jgi:hypothetical protein